MEFNKLSAQNPAEYKEKLAILTESLKVDSKASNDKTKTPEENLIESIDNKKLINYLERRTKNSDNVCEAVTFTECPAPWKNEPAPKFWTAEFEYAYDSKISDEKKPIPPHLSRDNFNSKEFKQKIMSPDENDRKAVIESEMFIAYLLEGTEGRVSGVHKVDNVKNEQINAEIKKLEQEKMLENNKFQREIDKLIQEQANKNKEFEHKIKQLQKGLASPNTSLNHTENETTKKHTPESKLKLSVTSFEALASKRIARNSR